LFLIPKTLLLTYVSNRSLDIDPLVEADFGNTFYYFHLGDRIQVVSPRGHGALDLRTTGSCQIPPHAFVRAYSLEHFKMSNRILGLFSISSELVHRKGLSIANSLAIDPGFAGNLEIGLKNETDDPVMLRYKERIGKILFFDVADTYELAGKGGNIQTTKLRVRDKGAEFTEDDDYPGDLGDA